MRLSVVPSIVGDRAFLTVTFEQVKPPGVARVSGPSRSVVVVDRADQYQAVVRSLVEQGFHLHASATAHGRTTTTLFVRNGEPNSRPFELIF